MIFLLAFFVLFYFAGALWFFALWSDSQGINADGPLTNAAFALIWPFLVVARMVSTLFGRW